jgi:hypothetical protein
MRDTLVARLPDLKALAPRIRWGLFLAPRCAAGDFFSPALGVVRQRPTANAFSVPPLILAIGALAIVVSS